MADFTKLEEIGIHYPPELQEYYTEHSEIERDTLNSVPFGPYEWTPFSIKDIIQTKHNRTECYIDVAIKFAGMGFYFVCGMSKDGQTFFFRIGGGSNDISRQDNSMRFIGWDPTQHQPQFNINQVIEIFNNEPSDYEQLLQNGDNNKGYQDRNTMSLDNSR